ncbi:uncharacterized protein LOC116450576 [Corvus moneduloides]|uniref:uncharacterized protein LOC116450576 n=1 Tax=Corvus moneduloides TaxID=1196302 RepID=UPI00136486EE|nr:uncharacterized protein LOC116450576 [Corvus moneduloides]
MGLTSGAGRASAEPSLPQHYRPPPLPAPPPPLSRPTHRGPRPPLRARDRGGPGAAPARRTRTRGTGRARHQRAGGGAGMPVRRRGREGPAPSLVPAGAAGDRAAPRPGKFQSRPVLYDRGQPPSAARGDSLLPAIRGPETPARRTPAPPPVRPAPAAAPRVPQRSLRLPRGLPAATPDSLTPARVPAAQSPRRRLCPCERPATASLPPPLSPNFSRPPALTRCPQPQHHVHGSGSVSLRAEHRRLNPCRAAPLPAGAGGDPREPPPHPPRPRTQRRDAPAAGEKRVPSGRSGKHAPHGNRPLPTAPQLSQTDSKPRHAALPATHVPQDTLSHSP